MAKKTIPKRLLDIDLVKCQWAMLCSSSSIDQERNNISLFTIIDQLNIESKAFDNYRETKEILGVSHPMELVICWRRTLDPNISGDEIKSDFKVKMIDPQGNNINEIFSKITIPENMKLLRLRLQMNGVLISVPGQYCFQIELENSKKNGFKKLFEIPFLVLPIKEPLVASRS